MTPQALTRLDDRVLGSEPIWTVPMGDTWQFWRMMTFFYSSALFAGAALVVSYPSRGMLLHYLPLIPLAFIPIGLMAHAAATWITLAP